MLKKESIFEVLKEVKDPELGLDIVSLGLVYDVSVEKDKVKVVMTFTTPFCPYASQLEKEVKSTIGELEGVSEVEVEVTFDPPWTKDRLSDEAKVVLGIN